MSNRVGTGPVFPFFEGRWSPVKGKHDHRYRAIYRGSGDPLAEYIVLSSCADCGATKVDDLNPDPKERRRLRNLRIERNIKSLNKGGEGSYNV